MCCIYCESGYPTAYCSKYICKCDTDEETEYNNEDEIMEKNHDRDLDDNKIISKT